MWLLTPVLVNHLASDQLAASGQFGDMYGFITSLFSGITIIGLVYTIVLQREDIRLSRQSVSKQAEELELTKQALINQQQELKDNRAEIIQNRDEIKLQHQTVKFQRFENTFFNMLDLLNGIRERKNLKMTQDFVPHILTQWTTTVGKSYREIYREKVLQLINPELETIRNFSNITDLIFSRKKKPWNRKKYFGILLAQLNPDEICILYFHYLYLENPPKYFHIFKDQMMTELNEIGSRHEPYIELLKHIETMHRF